jgi:hypothetical protein
MTPSEQRRSDAIADAETLRRNDARKVMVLLGEYADCAVNDLRQDNSNPDWWAQDAARTAFRAVPGLRGDR